MKEQTSQLKERSIGTCSRAKPYTLRLRDNIYKEYSPAFNRSKLQMKGWQVIFEVTCQSTQDTTEPFSSWLANYSVSLAWLGLLIRNLYRVSWCRSAPHSPPASKRELIIPITASLRSAEGRGLEPLCSRTFPQALNRLVRVLEYIWELVGRNGWAGWCSVALVYGLSRYGLVVSV